MYFDDLTFKDKKTNKHFRETFFLKSPNHNLQLSRRDQIDPKFPSQDIDIHMLF